MPASDSLPTRCGQRGVRLLEVAAFYPFWSGVGWESGYVLGQTLGVTMNADPLPLLLVGVGDTVGFMVGVTLLAAFQIYITGVESAPPTPAGTMTGDNLMPSDRTVWTQVTKKLLEGDYPTGPLAVSFLFSGAAWQYGAYLYRNEPLLVNCVMTASLAWMAMCATYLVMRYFGLFSKLASPVGRPLIPEFLLGRFMAEFFFVFTCTQYYGESNFLLQFFSTDHGDVLNMIKAGLSKFFGFFLFEAIFILPSEAFMLPRLLSAEAAAANSEERELLAAEDPDKAT